MNNIDSAMLYYRLAHDSAPERDPARSRYLYAQARVMRDRDPDVADSLLEELSKRYPNSDFGKEAQTNLGYVADLQTDDATELYRSANSFRLVKDYPYATRQYMAIVTGHPTCDMAAKALYALGYMHERDLNQPDSARYYYGLLVEKYPRSEYAKEVRPSLEFALAKLNGAEVSDSLLLNDIDKQRLEKAKSQELDPLQQMLKNNANALQVNGPNVNLPNIPGLVPGGNMNDLMKQQLEKLKSGVLPAGAQPAGTTPVITPPPPMPQDTVKPKGP